MRISEPGNQVEVACNPSADTSKYKRRFIKVANEVPGELWKMHMEAYLTRRTAEFAPGKQNKGCKARAYPDLHGGS